ncbi:MAG: zinc transporter [Legionellales bacterium RIFCSPHIGHO2_12_FULL_37_14]|nr:MAG: zinc transporter [Legionellales bacterium RIFCSPHIGHO2_12_FULL_37_14]
MISFIELKTLFAISIFVTIVLAGWYPLTRKPKSPDKHHHDHEFSIGETLATGIFLGAGLMHMLPEANALFQKQNFHYPFAELITGGTFLLFLWLEHLGQALYHNKHKTNTAFAILAWIMLSVHSLILGTALGLNENKSMIFMLFIAIITHKWAESFAIAVQIAKTSFAPYLRVTLFLSFALMTPLGIYFGWYFEHEATYYLLVDPILMAASAGTFFYLGTLHGLERCVLVERCCNLLDFSFVIIGFILMSAVAVYL